MNAGPKRILITGVGGASGIVLSKHFSKKKPEYYIVGADANPNAPGQVFCDEFHTIPYANDPEFVPKISQICKNSGVEALFSTVDEELPVVSANSQKLDCKVLLSDLQPISNCLDKYLCMNMLEAAGVPVPKTAMASRMRYESMVAELGSIFITKLRTGRGSRGFYIIRNKNDFFHAAYRYVDYSHETAIAQEYLPGTEYTIDVILDSNGKFISCVPRERIMTDSGVSVVGKTVHDDEIEAISKKACEAMGLRYIVNLQIRRDAEGKPKVIEINPRPSGTLALAIAAGIDMPKIALEVSNGMTAANYPAEMKFIPGMKMYRYMEESFKVEE